MSRAVLAPTYPWIFPAVQRSNSEVHHLFLT